jgi:acetyl esterase/lipase
MSEVIKLKADDTHRTVRYTPNVVYATKDGVSLRLQLLQPASYEYDRTKPKLPCVVFVQGSAWLQQDIYHNVPQIADFAKRGYVTCIVEYRHSGIAPFPAQIMDAKTAVRFLRLHSDEYGIDANNMFLWGDSSGAHSAMGAAFSADLDCYDDGVYKEVSAAVNGVIDFCAPVDLYEMREEEEKWVTTFGFPSSPGAQFMGVKDRLPVRKDADKTKTANLITTDIAIPPVMIVHGDRDSVVPYSQSLLLKDALDAADKEYEMYELVGSDHSGPSFFQKEVYDLMEDFICRNLQ